LKESEEVLVRVLLSLSFIATKIASVGILAILLLGYVFFLSSHSDLTHLYVVATVAALIFTLISGPKLVQYKIFKVSFWLVVVAATALGTWKINEHLEFFEGPEYGPAVFDTFTICTYWVAVLYSQFALGNEGSNADA
jgi:hypothetical protein